MKTRTFVALAVNDEIRAGAARAIARLRGLAPSFRWVAEENLHFTLHFLGDLTDQEVVDVCRRVEQAAQSLAPFTLQALGVSAFPKPERPRTLWVGAGQGAEQVTSLHDAIGQPLADLGFRGEIRRFVPHMTIGKLSGRGGPPPAELIDELAQLAAVGLGAMVIDHVTVFASQLHREGPEYHVLARSPLADL